MGAINTATIEDAEAFLDAYVFSKKDINLEKPIIDVGAGHGTFSYAFLTKGVKKLLSIDILPENTNDIKEKVSHILPNKMGNISIICDDFSTSEEISAAMRKKDIALVFLSNVMHFWSAPKIDAELLRIFDGLENGGALFVYEKSELMAQLYKDLNYPKAYILWNAAVKNSKDNDSAKRVLDYIHNYYVKSVPNVSEISYNYPLTQRGILFPFEQEVTDLEELKHLCGDSCPKKVVKQHFEPVTLKLKLEKIGFNIVSFERTEENMFNILAEKPDTSH